MDSGIIDFFKKIKHLKLQDYYSLAKISKLRTYSAGELIAEEGQYFKYVLGVRRGLIRTFLLKSNGEERTVRLVKEGDFAGCATCFLENQPSTEYLEAIEDTKVVLINAEHLKELSKNNIRILKFWNYGSMDALGEAVHRISFFVTLSPEERYLQLLDESPNLLQRVPQKHLASYIGISTVSFSRIKNRVAGKN